MTSRLPTKKANVLPKRVKRLQNAIRNIELTKAHDTAQMLAAENDFQMYSKLNGRKNANLATQAKLSKELYKIHSENCDKALEDVKAEIEYSLRGYTDAQRKIWIAYFMEQKSIEAIAKATAYSPSYIAKLLVGFRKDLEEDEEER